MIRPTRILIAITAAFALQLQPAAAQTQDIPEEMRAPSLPAQHLEGPRFGFTTFTQDIAAARNAIGKSRFMSQFGWQFEKQLVSTTTGHQALLEWVILVGGIEQDEFNVSLSPLAGYRLQSGLEFGVGPNLSLNSVSGEATGSMVTAIGMTMDLGELRVPANMAVAFAQGGPRITFLMGWIMG